MITSGAHCKDTFCALTLQSQLNMCAPPCAHVFVYLAAVAAAAVAWDMAVTVTRWLARGGGHHGVALVVLVEHN